MNILAWELIKKKTKEEKKKKKKKKMESIHEVNLVHQESYIFVWQ